MTSPNPADQPEKDPSVELPHAETQGQPPAFKLPFSTAEALAPKGTRRSMGKR
jgi:hypothetical protein